MSKSDCLSCKFKDNPSVDFPCNQCTNRTWSAVENYWEGAEMNNVMLELVKIYVNDNAEIEYFVNDTDLTFGLDVDEDTQNEIRELTEQIVSYLR